MSDQRERPGGRALPVGQLVLTRVGLDHPDAQLLVEEVQAEYVRRYGGRDTGPVDASEFEGERGAFHLGRLRLPDGSEPLVASGAWRWRPDLDALGPGPVAELKRMYVRPPWQRRGIARELLQRLEDEVRRCGGTVVVLETGTAQPEAMALYEAGGYDLIPGFGPYRNSPQNRCYARRVAGDPRP